MLQVIVKTPAGVLHRFDFGPVGGDIAFEQAPQLPMAAMLGRTWRGGSRRARAAEVRECKVATLTPPIRRTPL